jgi:hypothetical protein
MNRFKGNLLPCWIELKHRREEVSAKERSDWGIVLTSREGALTGLCPHGFRSIGIQLPSVSI